MHAYSANESRVPAYTAMAVASVVISWLLVSATSGLDVPEWLIGAPSMAGVFAVLYQLFDRWGWKTRPARMLGLSGTPDIAGDYDGQLISTFEQDGKKVRRKVRFAIRQTWTRVLVTMDVSTKASSSSSISAEASINPQSDDAQIRFLYHNKVTPGVADEDMSDHDGAADLRIRPDGTMTGRYFNSRPRRGSITAKRT